jgi:large subunit ribosomal protein L29
MPSKAAAHREADETELEHRLAEAKQEVFNLRFQIVTGQLDNSARLRTVKRDIARILTILREKEIEAAEATDKTEAGESA